MNRHRPERLPNLHQLSEFAPEPFSPQSPPLPPSEYFPPHPGQPMPDLSGFDLTERPLQYGQPPAQPQALEVYRQFREQQGQQPVHPGPNYHRQPPPPSQPRHAPAREASAPGRQGVEPGSRHTRSQRHFEMHNPVANDVELAVARAFLQRERDPGNPDAVAAPILGERSMMEFGAMNNKGERQAMDLAQAGGIMGIFGVRGYLEQHGEAARGEYRLSPKWFAERFPALRQRIMQEESADQPVWGLTQAQPHHVEYERVPRSLVDRQPRDPQTIPFTLEQPQPPEQGQKKYAQEMAQVAVDRSYAELPPQERSYRILTTIRNVDPIRRSGTAELPSKIDAETAVGLFTYADALGPQALGEANTPNARKYAQKLSELYNTHGAGDMSYLAMAMAGQAEESLKAVGINATEYCKSPTWALWDIAKQAYLAEHPEESDPQYATRTLKGETFNNLVDPTSESAGSIEADGEDVDLADLKRQEIIDRHVGWETVAAWYGTYPRRLGNIPQTDARFAEIVDIIENGQKNETFFDGAKTVPALRSSELARIGAIVDDIIFDQPREGAAHLAKQKYYQMQQLVANWPRT